MKISIVTVVWNAVESIEQTLNSVRAQDYENLEFIVVDGVSDDGTLDILKDNMDIIHKFKSEKDDGLYYAMNKGKNLATGDFVLFMNAGDLFIDNSVISKMAAGMIDPEIMYYGNTVVYFGETKKIAARLHHQSLFYPKSFYKKEDYNCEKFKVVAESDYTHRALAKYKTEHIEVNIILSRLEGFRIHRYAKLGSALKMYKEVLAFMADNNKSFNLIHKLGYTAHSILKFCAFQIGGLPLAAKLVLRRSRPYKA